MPRAALVWHDRIPAVRRDPPSWVDLLRVRLFPPSYRAAPWPIPELWARKRQRAAYLRSIGLAIEPPRSPFRDAVVAVLACAAVVALLTVATRLWAWGHL